MVLVPGNLAIMELPVLEAAVLLERLELQILEVVVGQVETQHQEQAALAS